MSPEVTIDRTGKMIKKKWMDRMSNSSFVAMNLLCFLVSLVGSYGYVPLEIKYNI